MIAANCFQLISGALPLLVILTFATSKSIVNVAALFLPLIALVLVCTGIGFLVSALYVFFRDLPYFYELIVFFFLFSSPIFYPAAIISDKVRPFLNINPLSSIIESIRQLALSGNAPDFSLIVSALLSGIVLLILGWSCFRLWQPEFMDLL
jgi:ABC-2 type transport system permease protein/lipopolysaccharide transport system permease protein